MPAFAEILMGLIILHSVHCRYRHAGGSAHSDYLNRKSSSKSYSQGIFSDTPSLASFSGSRSPILARNIMIGRQKCQINYGGMSISLVLKTSALFAFFQQDWLEMISFSKLFTAIIYLTKVAGSSFANHISSATLLKSAKQWVKRLSPLKSLPLRA